MDELIRTGQVRFEYYHILNHGPPSVFAALATECGGDQGAWWDFHDHYMTTNDFSRDGALRHATSLELDTEQFAECVDSEQHLDFVIEQHRASVEAGVRRTPTVRINGEGAAIVAEPLIEQAQALAAELQAQESDGES